MADLIAPITFIIALVSIIGNIILAGKLDRAKLANKTLTIDRNHYKGQATRYAGYYKQEARNCRQWRDKAVKLSLHLIEDNVGGEDELAIDDSNS